MLLTSFIFNGRAPLSLDLLLIALIVVSILLNLSIYLVKYKKQYNLHKILQIIISIALVFVIIVFELDMRINGWVHLAESSPYYNTFVWPSLIIHISCSVFTLIFWFTTLIHALKNFSTPPVPGIASQKHKKYSFLSILGLHLTIVTGLIFYYLSFIAR